MNTPEPLPMMPQRRFGLQGKLVCALLAIAMVPLLVAAILIEQTAQVAHNFVTNETAFLRPPLESAKSVYLDLIDNKRDYYRQVALRLADVPEVVAVARDRTADQKAARARMEPLFQEIAELHAVAVTDARGVRLVGLERPEAVTRPARRPLTVAERIADTQARVRLTFAVSVALQEQYTALSRALKRAERMDEVRSALPSSYRWAFWMLVGGILVLVTVAGLFIARRITVRISALVSGTRQVAAGDLNSQVLLPGRDELTELAWAFNRMVDDLKHDREQIAYLQRVSAWQEVARKLAHEIKNPLTPIQLVVQQVVSSYRGDDERFRKLLADTEEIVTEEISSLRRLVDAFRTLGQLPRVDAKPLDLGTVVDDLTKDPALIDHLDVQSPPQPVRVRGDRMLLRRVLTNLVENGIQAARDAGAPGMVTIRWHADRERAQLSVDDDGPGVPASKREQIFEPYITGKTYGTGLGLTICKKIALDHQGSLTVAPDPAPAGGARFVLSLPLATKAGELSGADGEDRAAGAEDE